MRTIHSKNQYLNDHFLSLAFEVAISSIGVSDPNPPVGSVLIHRNGKLLAKGSTQVAGGVHAEVDAIQKAKKLVGQEGIEDATLYVTLEPCCHQGKTPPCTEYIVQNKIKNVYIASVDHTEKVNGKGIHFLRKNNISTHIVASDRWKLEKYTTLQPFFYREKYNRPMVYLKWAQDIKGNMAPLQGPSYSITSLKSRILLHRLRKKFRACIVTPGTILTDMPRLDTRLANRILNRKKFIKKITTHHSNSQNKSTDQFLYTFLGHDKHKLFSMFAATQDRTHYFRYFILPKFAEKWQVKELNNFIYLQTQLKGNYFFFSFDKVQCDILENAQMPFLYIPDKQNFDLILKHIGDEGHNQVLVEAGPTYAQFLSTSNIPNAYIVFTTPCLSWNNHGRGFDLSYQVARHEFQDTLYQAGYTLLCQNNETMSFFIKNYM